MAPRVREKEGGGRNHVLRVIRQSAFRPADRRCRGPIPLNLAGLCHAIPLALALHRATGLTATPPRARQGARCWGRRDPRSVVANSTTPQRRTGGPAGGAASARGRGRDPGSRGGAARRRTRRDTRGQRRGEAADRDDRRTAEPWGEAGSVNGVARVRHDLTGGGPGVLSPSCPCGAAGAGPRRTQWALVSATAEEASITPTAVDAALPQPTAGAVATRTPVLGRRAAVTYVEGTDTGEIVEVVKGSRRGTYTTYTITIKLFERARKRWLRRTAMWHRTTEEYILSY